jgi:hypothetical protein
LGLLALNPLFTAPAHGDSVSDCVPAPAGLVAWWPAEGNASDVIGGVSGSIIGTLDFADGMVGQSFVFDHSTSYISMPASPSLDIGATGSGITIECWIKPDAYHVNVTGAPIIEWDSDTTDGLQFWSGSTLYANVMDTLGNSHGIEYPVVFDTNHFQHVALTYDKASGVAVLYLNGTNVVSTHFGSITPQTTYPVNIGRRTGQPVGLNDTYGGLIDELSLYNRALTQTEIQFIYHAGSAGKCPPVPAAVPAIFNFTPLVGTNGTEVKISGTNFSATVSSNIVYFGAVQAPVLSASPTNLVVTVPVGATLNSITVTAGGLIAYSSLLFEPTFNGNGLDITPDEFTSGFNLGTGGNPGSCVIVDLDGDGKPDIALVTSDNHSVAIFRNISTNGTLLSAASFAPRIDLPFPTTGVGGAPYRLRAVDLDGDGKLDLIACEIGGSRVSVFHNLATPGFITTNSFEPAFSLDAGSDCRFATAADLDGDGRADIVALNYGDKTISVFKNIGTVGSLTTNSFAAPVVLAAPGGPYEAVIADLNGDGKPDLAVASSDSGTVSIYQNIATPGVIATNSFAPRLDLPGGDILQTITAVDLDGDGQLDLVAGSVPLDTVLVYRNLNTGELLTTNSFAPPVNFGTPGWMHTVTAADFNGDGKPDICVVGELPNYLSIFQNNSTPGSFTSESIALRVDFGTGWNPWGVAAGDLDGDGRPDIVFCNYYDSTISIYQNQTPFSGPPVITMPPTNETAVEGASTVLSVAATGAVPLAYQWSFNGATLPGATNATLTLTNLHSNQAGNYQVRVANAYGAVTSSAAVVTVAVQSLLVYTYSGTEEVTTSNLQFSYKYSGQMFFIPAGTNGTFIGWGVVNGKKQFWVSPFADYQLIRIPGSANRTYTVLGKAGENVDVGNNPHLWSYLHRGQNEMLTIASRQKFSFPETFTCNDTHVYPDAQTGKMILREAASTYTFAPQSTQTANNNGKTMIDLVNALTQTLVRQGYKQQ